MFPMFPIDNASLTASDRRLICGLSALLMLVVTLVVALTAPAGSKSMIAYMSVITVACGVCCLLEHRTVRRENASAARG